MAIDWKQRAAEAIKAGYLEGNQWERMLRRHLEGNFPELVKELDQSKDLKAYCQVKTAAAIELDMQMVDQGTDPEIAREFALKQLLETAPD